MQKSTLVRKEDMQANRKWYVIDANGLVLGDLAVKVADTLRGKNKVIYTPGVDCGDYVIVKNARKIVLTGNKMQNKKWYTNSGWCSGLRTRSATEMLERYSDEVILEAVKGMIPKNHLGAAVLRKLFVYADEGKAHEAQSPIVLTL